MARRAYAALALLVLACLLVPASAETGPAATAKLFSDGSAKLVVRGEAGVEAKGELKLHAIAKLKKCGLTVEAEARGVLSNKTKTPLRIEVTGTSETRGNITKGSAAGEVWFSSPNLTAIIDFEIESLTNLTEMKSHIEGTAKLNVSGKEAPSVLMQLAFLNKFNVEQFLRQSNITWVKVERLNTTVEPGAAKIDFAVVVDLKEYSKVAAKTLKQMAPELAAEYEELVAKSIEGVSRFKMLLSVKDNEFYFKLASAFVGDVSRLIEAVKKGFLFGLRAGTVQPYAPTGPAAKPPAPEVKALKEYVEKVSKVLEDLEVVLPSTAKVDVELSSGKISFYAETPKLRLKGAKNPVETLKALKELLSVAVEVSEEHEIKTASETLEGVMNTTVALVAGDPGVEVITKQLCFRELERAQVRLVAPPPSTVVTVTSTVVKTVTTTKTVTATVEKTVTKVNTVTTTKTVVKTSTVTVKELPLEVVGGLVVLLIVVAVVAALLARR